MKKLIIYIFFFLSVPTFLIANDCNYLMDDNRMISVLQQMENQTNDTKKINIIKAYLQRLCINTNQMLTIMEVFESEQFKHDFFIYSKEFITDLENYKKLVK
tara:strand:+ start:369 stop:674 length:306 start_codon:yes stop_codon:yes gene_type:complete